eukprot:9101658-Pyramimonas_sp.AAC.1
MSSARTDRQKCHMYIHWQVFTIHIGESQDPYAEGYVAPERTAEHEFPFLRSIHHGSGSWAILMAFHHTEREDGYRGYMFKCVPDTILLALAIAMPKCMVDCQHAWSKPLSPKSASSRNPSRFSAPGDTTSVVILTLRSHPHILSVVILTYPP